MRYTHFRINNFKGIKHLRLELTSPPRGPIHTLVGLNESGKTTILEAINFFSYGTDELDPVKLSGCADPDVHDLIPISKRSNFNGDITVTAGFELEKDEIAQLQSHLRRDFRFRFDSCSTTFEVTDRYTFESSKLASSKKLWTFDLKGKQPSQKNVRRMRANTQEWQASVNFLAERMPRIWYFPNFLFDFPERIYLADQPNQDPTLRDVNNFYLEVLQDILDSLQTDSTVEEHITRRIQSSDKHDSNALDNLLLEMGRDVTRQVFTAWNNTFSSKIANKSVKLDVGHDENGQAYLYFRIVDADGYFAVSERSLGFRWFFVYLLITSYRALRKDTSTNILFLLDEPASNLHSNAQAQLLRSLDSLAKRCWIIYTTHSHYLINPDWLESTYVVRNAGLEYDESDNEFSASKTEITAIRYRKFVATSPNQTSYFKPILDVLEYRPSTLEDIPDAVMVEGKNDFYLLKYMIDVALGSSHRVNLCPGGGAGSLDNVVRLYVAWGRQFVVLLDSDVEGIFQKKRYHDIFGELVTARILSLADLDADAAGISLDRLLEESERLAVQQITYEGDSKFHKKHFGRAVQEALVRRIPIELSAGTLEKFNGIVTALRTRLEQLGTSELSGE